MPGGQKHVKTGSWKCKIIFKKNSSFTDVVINSS